MSKFSQLAAFSVSLVSAAMLLPQMSAAQVVDLHASDRDNVTAQTPVLSTSGQAGVTAAMATDTERKDDEGTKKAKRHDIRGEVIAITGTDLTVKANNGTTYNVDASQAKIVRRFGAVTQVADIQLHDSLNVRGTLSGTDVHAASISDVSLQARNGRFEGKVVSVDAQSFVLRTRGRGDQTILTDGNTKFKKNGKPALLADVAVDSQVHVDGVWDRTNKNVTARLVSITVKLQNLQINGKIAAIVGNTLTVTAKNGTSYMVDVSHARFLRRHGVAAQADLKVGDSVRVRGQRMGALPNVNATWLQDLSLTAALK